MHRSRLEIENKELEFHFEIASVQFNEVGRYALRLTVENALLEGSAAGVRLRVNGGEEFCTNSATTDVVAQTSLGETLAVTRKTFLFRLIKGYCQNDKNHDVRLRLEAFRVTGSSPKGGQKAGEAFLAIYPRTDAPRINVSAKDDQDLYCYSSVLALLRVRDDALSLHCGRMAYKVRFHETRLQRNVPRADSTPAVNTGSTQPHPLSPNPLAMTARKMPSLPIELMQQGRALNDLQSQQWVESKEGADLEPLPELHDGSPPPTPERNNLLHPQHSTDSSFRLSSPEHIPSGRFETRKSSCNVEGNHLSHGIGAGSQSNPLVPFTTSFSVTNSQPPEILLPPTFTSQPTEMSLGCGRKLEQQEKTYPIEERRDEICKYNANSIADSGSKPNRWSCEP